MIQTGTCVCGRGIELVDTSANSPWWAHTQPNPTCPGANPVVTTDNIDRKLDKVHQDIRDMHTTLDEIEKLMQASQARLNSPEAVRHATLDEVWHVLRDAGYMYAAAVVQDMIKHDGQS